MDPTPSSSSITTDTTFNVDSDEIEKPIRKRKVKTLIKGNANLDSTEATSSFSSSLQKGKIKRRNPRVHVVRRIKGDVSAIGLPLGMSFAAVMAQVLYRRDAAAGTMSPDHLSAMCTSAIKKSLSNVYGDKLDGLTRNFEQSFGSTLSTLRLIYESSASNEGKKINTMKMEIPSFILSNDKGDRTSDVLKEDSHSEEFFSAQIEDQFCDEEIKGNFHVDSVSRGLTLHEPSNLMVPFSSTSSECVINKPMISTFEKSVVEQCRSNDLKTFELGLAMKKLKLKETQLALHYDLNNLERSRLAMGVSKASFKAEKFKTQLEDMRYGELKRKCIDCLIAGLLIMSSSLLYAAYVYSYERISEATGSCTPSTEAASSWWTPKSVSSFNSRLHVFLCQVQVMSRMVFGVLMISAIAYLLVQRPTMTSQTMPITFILLLLGIGCGYFGKLCVATLGGNGYVWLLYWEGLCLLHFLCTVFTSTLYPILHGPVTASKTTRGSTFFPYWIRQILFYATLFMFLPVFCGTMPFATLSQWRDHFLFKVLGSDEPEW
ncbi:PREDICTED: protein CPR-5 [Lupinus angustifolius]|uniref:protein CPR-5 n=1 Tax=Lupinus angustifolius TaxID=3871 RepID=UPI00092E770E|nr:PREDICTED: protein CPR-5 [Lupinus angustifolius]